MDQKKEQERNQLYKTIWNLANELRGSVDGWDFKAYVLGFLFYRFLSENFKNYVNETEWKAGNSEFNYADISDEKYPEKEIKNDIRVKGFFIYPSQLFENVRKNALNDKNLSSTLGNIFKEIENSAKGTHSEGGFVGLFEDIDVNNKKLGDTVKKRNNKLIEILNVVGDMDLGNYQDNTIDAFGDAYEYLMSLYAANAGKSGGEYYTPQEVSELLTLLATNGKEEINKVYDPAVGSGSLLLKVAKLFGKDKVRQGFFGQEINLSTYNLARINMILHDIPFNHFNIAHGDTLIEPKHNNEEPFDVIVSNPPYSIKWPGKNDMMLVNDDRFSPAGVLAPPSKADLAFIMHCLFYLSSEGTAAIVCFPGVLYRGGAEQKIRKYLVDNNYIDAIIQLPPNLFFGTSIATCIMVLKKMKKDNKILFINASEDYIKVTNNNKLSPEHIGKIVDTFSVREEVEYYARLVSREEIAEKDYNLSIQTYIEEENTEEEIDIEALMTDYKRTNEDIQKYQKEFFNLIKELEDLNV